MKVRPIGFGGVEAVLNGEAMPGRSVRGKLGQSNGYGFAVCGASRWGNSMHAGGIYKKYSRNGEVRYMKVRTYAPTNPNSPAQNVNRTIFASAVAAWADLTDAEKKAYNARANKRGKIGRGLFISEFMHQYN